MLRVCARKLVVFASVVLLPAMAYAQASITGVVRDASGAVLPGVTVEAASPVLIEKVRTVVTDGSGQYRIVDLRPGPYTVTFTLAGFSTVRRDGITLSGSFTASVDAEMRIGAIEETVTVTGEAPTVDVQSSTRQRVLDKDIVDALPVARSYTNLAVLIPGVSSNNQDVGGSQSALFTDLMIHGSKSSDMRETINGLSIGTMSRDGNQANIRPSLASVQEVAIDTGGANAEIAQGGVRVNFIPREGGNRFAGSVYLTGANTSMQSDNFTQDLKDRGAAGPTKIKSTLDFNPAFGGPIKQDRLWFWAAVRYNPLDTLVGNFANLNASNPDSWTYEPDLSRPSVTKGTFRNASIRLTWQATARHKLAVFYDEQSRFESRVNNSTTSPEAASDFFAKPQRPVTVDWTFPATNRLLFEASAFGRSYPWSTNGEPPNASRLIQATEQSSGLVFRGRQAYNLGRTRNFSYRFATSYVTGAHAAKVGFTHAWGRQFQRDFGFNQVSYRLNNGVPNQISLNSNPLERDTRLRAEFGVYAQDRWTIRRLTLNLGVRYDYFDNYEPEQRLGPTPLTPNRDFVFPQTEGVKWHDITPKLGMAYDLFGTGRTALKASLNKYVQGLSLGGTFGNGWAPIGTLVTATTRNWNDRDGDFVPDCELSLPAANGECAAMANRNFGSLVPGATYDQDTMRGWGKRGYNWEFSTGIQHEIAPRVSVSVDYFRRWYGNFVVTDNLALGPADFDQFSIVAPADARLPGGGGQTIAGLVNLNPARFGVPANNLITFADNYGKQIEQWNGVDISASARLQNGLLIQGGVGTGQTRTDNCEVVAQLPETLLSAALLGNANGGAWLPSQFCKQESPFLTQFKGLATYRIPRIDVQLSTTIQSIPGPHIAANFVASNAAVAASLGRPLSGGASSITVDIVEPGTLYGERINQVDIRVGKILRFGGTRTNVNLDIFNAGNANTVLTENSNFGVWRRPQSILQPRIFKISAQFDF